MRGILMRCMLMRGMLTRCMLMRGMLMRGADEVSGVPEELGPLGKRP